MTRMAVLLYYGSTAVDFVLENTFSPAEIHTLYGLENELIQDFREWCHVCSTGKVIVQGRHEIT